MIDNIPLLMTRASGRHHLEVASTADIYYQVTATPTEGNLDIIQMKTSLWKDLHPLQETDDLSHVEYSSSTPCSDRLLRQGPSAVPVFTIAFLLCLSL